MYNFKAFLEEVCQASDIRFNLIMEDNSLIFKNDINTNASELYSLPIFLGNKKAELTLNKEYKTSVPLLKYTIETKYREMFSLREQLLIDILEGKEIPIEKIERYVPFLTNGCEIIVVNIEGSRYEALSIIRQIYMDRDVLTSALGDNVVILGELQDVEEHARSIIDSITTNLYCKSYVSFSDKIYDIPSVKKAYDEAKECLFLGKKFRVREEVFNYKKMLFEKIVYNIDESVKKELLDELESKLNLFDDEMITTIEEFVNSGLNVSEAAKNLYVHRNTLIYRLEKIKKETGFDLRNFKEASVFIISFLVWKESK